MKRFKIFETFYVDPLNRYALKIEEFIISAKENSALLNYNRGTLERFLINLIFNCMFKERNCNFLRLMINM